MSDSDSSSSSNVSSRVVTCFNSLKRKEAIPNRPTKSSSEILNELFGTFNTSFDAEPNENIPSSPESKTKKLKRKKKKEHRHQSKKKKSSEKDKSKRKRSSRPNKKKHRSRSNDRKSIAENSFKRNGEDEDVGCSSKSVKPLVNDTEENEKPAKARPKFPTVEINGQIIVLDVEEGEIIEDEEVKSHGTSKKIWESLRREKPLLKKNRNSSEEKRKRRKSSKDESSKSYKPSTASRTDNSRHSYHDDSDGKHRRSSASSSNSKNYRNHRSRSNSRSPRRYSQSVKSNDRNSYKSIKWEKARDRSPDSIYKSRRISVFDYDYRKYSGSRGGFGFTGQSFREVDDFFDFRHRRDFGYDERYERSRSPSRSVSRYRERSTLRRLHPDDIIDKAVLRDIARTNAAKLMKQGVLPTDIFSKAQILAIKAGGKSVEELTDYCRRLAKKDAAGDADDDSGDERLINHPFMVKDKPFPSITMNIRNAIPLPIRTPHEMAIESAKLKIQFPVSSGTQHRHKEIEWKEVDKQEDLKGKKKKEDLSKALVPLDGKLQISENREITLDPKPSTSVDIGAVISVRLRAMKELQDNPDDLNAKERLDQATAEMKEWAEAKALEPKFLTPADLQTGPQAWVKKDQLKTATALQGGMGMHLLQRMGWCPGEGLGKNKEGSTEPLALDIKTDKKGLASSTELKGPSLPTVFDLSGKHPVSSLMELCAKRRWGDPTFLICFEYGPSHKPQFVYKVTVNGVEYQPCVATTNKKEAKSNAAAFCLQSLGLLPTPKTPVSTVTKPAELLKTVPDSKEKSKTKKEDKELMPPPTSLTSTSSCDRPPLQSLLSLSLTNPNLVMPSEKVTNRLMNLPIIPQPLIQTPSGALDESFFMSTPSLIQVPLPSTSLNGFPGLTTF